MPLLTICIATLDRAADLRHCFDALLLTQGLDAVEILVINNGDGEESRAISEAYMNRLPIRYIRQNRHGLGESLNLGWRTARSEWVAYIDDDSIVYPSWTGAILKKLPGLKPSCFAMAGNVDMGPHPPVLPAWCHPKFARSAYSNTGFGATDRYLEFPDSPLGNNMAIRKSHLECYGGFSNELRTYWENHITWIGYWNGGTCFYNAEMRVAHIPSPARLTKKWALNKTRLSGRDYQRALKLLQDYPRCPPRYDFLIRLPVATAKLIVSWAIRSPRHVTAFQAGLQFEWGRIEELFRKTPQAEYSTYR